MSYCRAGGDSDVYVMATAVKGKINWWCVCDNPDNFTETREAMLEHLYKHREDGDRVPEYAIERLQKEIRELQ